MLAVPDRVKRVMHILTRAADEGDRCPDNATLSEALGARSLSTGAACVSLLESMNLIRVERGSRTRIVTIVATGRRTAGKINLPHFTCGKWSDFWDDDRDASLMDVIAEGGSFKDAAEVCGTSQQRTTARFNHAASAHGSAGTMSRPNCLNRDACTAAKPTSHCRRCSALRMITDPTVNQKRRAALQVYHDKPEVKAALAARIQSAFTKASEDPAYKEVLRERGRVLQRDFASRPEIRALINSPEARARRGAAITARRLAWCPPELRQAYRDLVRCKGLCAADARAAIQDLIDAPTREARRAIAKFDHDQRERHAREQREAY